MNMSKFFHGNRTGLDSSPSLRRKLAREFGAYVGVALLPFMRRDFSPDSAGHNQGLAVLPFLGVFWIYRSVGIIFDAGEHDATKANPALLVAALLLIPVSFLMPTQGTDVSELAMTVTGYFGFLYLWVRYDAQKATKRENHTIATNAPGAKATG